MAIRITKSGKEFKKTIDGTTFALCRLSTEEDTALQRAHQRRGNLDVMPYAVAKLEKAVRGWDTIIVDGDEVGFDRALIKEFPDSLRVALLEALDAGEDPLAPSSGTI